MSTTGIRAGAFAAAVCVGLIACGGDDDSPIEPTPVCTYTISPGNQSFGGEGGTGNVSVATEAGCTWSATANASWIGITAGGTGTGSGTVVYSVPANQAAESRTGTLTIAGHSHAVVQEGRTPSVCTYDIAPARADVGKDSATGTITVTARDGCSWKATSRVGWITISAGAEGSGTGSVSYSVARNTEAIERVGTMTVAERTFTVRQAGDAGVCQYSVTPVDFEPCMPGGTLTATVTTQANCPWTVTSSAAWLSVASSGSGSGSGVIALSFSDNYDAPRQGTVMVRWPTPTAGQNVRVAQAGCIYAVSRSDISFAAAGGSGSFGVIQQSQPTTCGGATQDRCVWTARADVPWITVTSSMPRAGDDPVAFTVAANASGATRVGRITVGGRVVVITQAGL